jgi:hypothetical protein
MEDLEVSMQAREVATRQDARNDKELKRERRRKRKQRPKKGSKECPDLDRRAQFGRETLQTQPSRKATQHRSSLEKKIQTTVLNDAMVAVEGNSIRFGGGLLPDTDYFTGNRYLGVQVALNGNFSKEINIRKDITGTKVKRLQRYPTSPLVKIIIRQTYYA